MSTSVKHYDWTDLVKEVEGDAYFVKPIQYEFSNGRQFREHPDSGVYQQEQGD